jgi:L-alanine-DL-glutamate epimerase-like enolase superfamily enzyme
MTRVARIDAFPLRYPEPHDGGRTRHVTLVRAETDDGAVGWGECISQWPEAALAVKTVIDRGLAELVLGEDPTRVEDVWRRLRAHTYWHGRGGIVSFAVSAIDIALWDLAGKIAGVPVHALLGNGATGEALPVCASVILDTLDLDHTREQFADYRNRGFRAVKGGWGIVAEAGFGLDRDRDLRVAATVREAVGPEVEVALDVSAHAGWDHAQALEMTRALAEFDLAWLEDPLPHEDVRGYARLHADSPIPLATGERFWVTAEYRWVAEAHGVDLVLIDPGRIEGISGMRAAAEVVAEYGVQVVPHSWSSAINSAAALHVLAAIPNARLFELKPDRSPMQHELVHVPFEQNHGVVAVPDAPGLGIEVDEATVRRYAFD